MICEYCYYRPSIQNATQIAASDKVVAAIIEMISITVIVSAHRLTHAIPAQNRHLTRASDTDARAAA